jgi:cyclopropane fatty-acyl-phospholipid synthase-like methyltransferase
MQDNDSILELGAGDGRDSIFFASRGLKVTAIEQVESCCNSIEDLSKGEVKAISADFTGVKQEELGSFDVVYSRFTLHSITALDQICLFQNLPGLLNKGGRLMIEVRSVKDPIYGKGQKTAADTYLYNDHQRRFVRIESIVSIISKLGFTVFFAGERQGWAPHKML